MTRPRVELVRPWRGMTPHERQQARRHRLLEAALEEFGTVGFRAATVGAICVRAELTNRYFYEHFADREAALRAVYDDLLTRALEHMGAALEGGGDFQERIMAALDAYLSFVMADPRRPRVISVESVGVSPAMEERRRAARHTIADLVDTHYARGVAAGDLVDRPFRKQALALVGAANELVIDWVLGERTATVAEVSADIAEVYLPLLRSRRARP
ncbi:TetR/AcrR family transcriptional regulator [Nocardiopsis sp. N85]|uniref:TetR/AcrR family transcriptional regulator n=1 Tax=Nocardiopsis sp. N85 TaxID=3029400 RepID=UPI00237EF37F|nr:TetR/AcrR family transcriptional regulator [Nocardiopsis sp. N85]MDE3722791.1 TetR/AcrR family transcriptional regulator [Nocardiopsis sp. N85]